MLDTDTSSYITRGGYGSVERRLSIRSPSDLCISAMTRAEITYGLKALPAHHRLHESARRYFDVVALLPWKAEAADVYAEIKHQLKITGTPIGELDMMIAAHAIAADAVLVTNNTRHFERIKLPLMLENWME